MKRSVLERSAVRAPLRIGLLGQFGIGNLGNDGSLEAMLRFLGAHEPTAELVCICSDPDLIQRTYGIAAAPLRAFYKRSPVGQFFNDALLRAPGQITEFRRSLQYVAALDALIIPGTGILDDFCEAPFGLPYDLWRWCRAANLRGVRVGFVSVGAGPIKNRLSLWFMRGAACSADYRSFRDEPSRTFASENFASVMARDSIYPDLAFGLPAHEPHRAAGSNIAVAIAPMAYYGWNGKVSNVHAEYVAKLTEYAAWLLTKGWRIKFVIGKDRDVDTVNAIRRALLERLPDFTANIEPFEPAGTLQEVMRQMAEVDVAVVSRFHTLVSALRMGTPTISLGYASKNEALLAEFGMDAYCQGIEDFDVARLRNQTEEIIARRADHEALIGVRLRAYETLIEDQNRQLTLFLEQAVSKPINRSRPHKD